MRNCWPFVIGAVAVIGCGLYAQAELVDGIVATVGPEVILQSEIMQEIAPAVNDLRKAVKDEAEFSVKVNDLVKKALDQAIEYKILLREGNLAGVEITDAQVEERIAEIKKRFASNEEFTKELEKAGETISDFRARIRKQIIAISTGMRKRREFEKAAEVTEADISQYYKDSQSKLAHPERVQLRRIFMAAGADKNQRAQVQARMEAIKKQIDAGADFAELAKNNSTGPDASQGGLMGWVVRNDLVKNLEDAAFATPPDAVTGVLETEGGFVILKVEKKEDAATPSLDEARKQLEPELRAKFATERYTKWMAELRKRSRVRVFL